MARLSDKEFSIRYELTQLRRDQNRLERLKERTDDDLSATRQRIKVLKEELAVKPKSKKKAAPKKTGTIYSLRSKRERKLKEEATPEKLVNCKHVLTPASEEEKISEVKIDADSLVALEDSVPVEKKKKEKEDEKTDSA